MNWMWNSDRFRYWYNFRHMNDFWNLDEINKTIGYKLVQRFDQLCYAIAYRNMFWYMDSFVDDFNDWWLPAVTRSQGTDRQ